MVLQPQFGGAATMVEESSNRSPAELRGAYMLAREGATIVENKAGIVVRRSWNRALVELHGDANHGAGTMVRQSCDRSPASCEATPPSFGCCNRGLQKLEPWSGGAARRQP